MTHSGVPIFGGLAIDCKWCGFAHLDPLPSQASLDATWRELYFDGYLYEQEARQQWYWRRVYLGRMRYFVKFLPGSKEGLIAPNVRIFRDPTCRLLDYGAGIGNFVASVREQFGWWEMYGYEPSGAARAKSRFPYQYISNPQPGYYDAVHCSLVLEHVLDPFETLRRINELLVPGGVACIVVPNEFNPLQRRLYRYGYSPLHLHHVNYFDQKSLIALVERAGFKVIELTATFPIEALALVGLNYVKYPKLGAVAHWLRMLFEAALLTFAPGAKRRLYGWFASKGVGREIELWIRAKSS